MLLSEHKKRVISLKQKDWSNSGVPATSTRCPDHLSREFLTTASTFPYSTKNSSVERIHAFYICPCVREWVRERERERESVCVCLSIWVSVFVRVWHVDKAWGIFIAVWKGKCGGQELSVEVIRAHGWGSWYPSFRSMFFALNMLPVCVSVCVSVSDWEYLWGWEILIMRGHVRLKNI